MTRREALVILIDEACRSVRGVGCGIREEVTADRRRRLREAVARVWRDAYGWNATESDFFNRGL